MRQILAYGLTILGISQLVGLLVGSVVSLPIAMVTPHHIKLRLAPPLLGVFVGAASLAAAVTLFWLLGVAITIFVPLIVGSWLTFYYFAYHQSRIEWYASVAGIIVFWAVYRMALSPA